MRIGKWNLILLILLYTGPAARLRHFLSSSGHSRFEVFSILLEAHKFFVSFKLSDPNLRLSLTNKLAQYEINPNNHIYGDQDNKF